MQQAEARAEAARDKRKREDEPKPEVKKVSTGKTDAMLAGLGSPEIKFFGKNRLKKMYEPGSGSSAYTEDSPVPNLHHPDFIKKALPSPAPSMHTAVYSDGDSPTSSSAGSSAGSHGRLRGDVSRAHAANVRKNGKSDWSVWEQNGKSEPWSKMEQNGKSTRHSRNPTPTLW